MWSGIIKGKVNICINIDLTNSGCLCIFTMPLSAKKSCQNHQVLVEAMLPEAGPRLIDNDGKVIIELNKGVMRHAVLVHFEELSKKKPEKSKEIMVAL